uniref:RNA-dependent RNA polymerase n=1 Tax=Caloscypha fulgens mycovirus 2 TaxID=2778770 RepID=A0A7L8Y985_9VIRU|nr:RNA-dependent RNA polymerase [Caloscypha fulgens mycovirus 2]
MSNPGAPMHLQVPDNLRMATLTIHSPSEGTGSSLGKRMRSVEPDDIELTGGGSYVGSISSGGSYATRRKRVVTRNSRAKLNAANRLKHKPEFKFIKVTDTGTYIAAYRPGLRFAGPDPQVKAYVEECGLPQGVRDADSSCFMENCDDARMRHMAYFDREALPGPRTHVDAYDRAVSVVSQLLTLPERLPFPHAEDLKDVRFKASKYPGILYRQRGFKNRAEAQPAALADAQEAWSDLMMGQDVRPHHVRLGGRGKAVMSSERDARIVGVPKGRLILMLSQRDLLLNGVVEQRLTKEYCSEEYPVSVGMGWFGGNSNRFIERLLRFKKLFCFDAEKFDASLDPYLVMAALRILRDQFEDGWDSKYDAYWEFVAESLIWAPVERDDGWVLHKKVGTTSGHNFNTLVQSIITLILGYATMFSLVSLEEEPDVIDGMSMDALGDDNLMGVEEFLSHYTCDEVGERMKEIFNISWLGDKSFATTAVADPLVGDEDFTEEGAFEGVQYLGKHFRIKEVQAGEEKITVAIPYRRCLETFTHLYRPESSGRTIRDTYLRAMGNLMDCYGNPWAAEWVNGLLDWLERKMEVLPVEWSGEQAAAMGKVYGSEIAVVPKLKRWCYEDWEYLVLWEKEVQPENFVAIDIGYS